MQPEGRIPNSYEGLLLESQRVRQEVAASIEILRATLGMARKLVANRRSKTGREPASPSRPTTAGLLNALTPREREVLRLIADGQSTKQIAETLQIRFKTAVCHRTRILQKLGAHETATLVRVAIRAGLVEP